MPLVADEVHLWLVDVSQVPLEDVLAPEERERAARFRRDEDRRRFAASRVSLRRLLARYVGAPARSLRFATRCVHCGADHGKPRLERAAGAPDVRFSTSHSGGLVAHAFALGREVGLDVESSSSGVAWREVSGRFFSEEERARLASCEDEAAARRLFLLMWTRKEALLKLSGLGLAGPLDEVQAAQAAGEDVELREVELPAGYVGAVAARGGVGTLRSFRLP